MKPEQIPDVMSREQLFQQLKLCRARQATERAEHAQLNRRIEDAKARLWIMLKNAPDPTWHRALMEVIENL